MDLSEALVPEVLSAPGTSSQQAVSDDHISRCLSRSRSQMRLYDTRKRHRYTVQHVNAKKISAYYRDLYHTLLNVPASRFLLVFIGSYLFMYIIFACFYVTQSKHCVSNIQKFTHALWFSVHTAATIGYGHQSPDPDCIAVNLAITCEVLTAALMQAALFGLVFARFATPSKRGSTILFSSLMVLQQSKQKHILSFRVANLRHHQVLSPRVTLLMVKKILRSEDPDDVDYVYKELKLQNATQESTVWLGLPVLLLHIIDEDSPLNHYVHDLNAMEEDEIEFVVLLDGVDEMTSTVMQARHSYGPQDIRWNHTFMSILRRGQTGAIVVDWEHFHTVLKQNNPGGEFNNE